MKKIVFFSEESVFSGNIKCGIAEVVDSLAHSLTELYQVNIVCKEGNSNSAKKAINFVQVEQGVIKGCFLKVVYYFVQPDFWPESAYLILDHIKPDILHNFSNPELISKIQNIPARTVFTFDDLNYLNNQEEFLKKYSFITTFSKGYSEYILTQENSAAQFLKETNFKKVSIGICTDIFDPEKGLFLPQSYNSQNFTGKEYCKERLLDRLNVPMESCLFLFMGRLIKEKGLEEILRAVSFITENNAKIIVVGKGEEKYEKVFQELSNDNKITYIKKYFFPAQILPLLAGSDFYLQPSLMESGGLMPMTASRYGTIPIVTQNGGLGDNFNHHNAIIVKNNIIESIEEAIELYNNKEELAKKRQIAMSQTFGWDTRNRYFIDLYEQ